MEKYVIIFLSLLYAFFGIFSASHDITNNNLKVNSQYTEFLTTAVKDTADQMASQADQGLVLKEKSDREQAVNTFYNSLALNFGYDTDEDILKLQSYVPAIVLVDTNGYYICYNAPYDDANGIPRLRRMITDINTWAVTTEHFLIRYYLGNKVDVTVLSDITVNGTDYKAGEIISGQFYDVYSKLSDYNGELSKNGFGPIGKKSDFEKARNAVIIPDIQKKTEYFINSQNKAVQSLGTTYIFEMPLTKDDDWSRALEHPTCIAFLQGLQTSNSDKYLNIYALGGGEVRKAQQVNLYKGNDGANDYYTYYEGDDPNNPSNDKTENKGAAGYSSGKGAVAKNGGQISYDIVEDEKNDIQKQTGETVQHSHYHNGTLKDIVINGETITVASEKGGCYTKPVYEYSNREITHSHHNEEQKFSSMDKALEVEPDASLITKKSDTEYIVNKCWAVHYHTHTSLCYDYKLTKTVTHGYKINEEEGHKGEWITGIKNADGTWTDILDEANEDQMYDFYFWDQPQYRNEAINALKKKYGESKWNTFSYARKASLINIWLKNQDNKYYKAVWDYVNRHAQDLLGDKLKDPNKMTQNELNAYIADWIDSMHDEALEELVDENSRLTTVCNKKPGEADGKVYTCGHDDGDTYMITTGKKIVGYALNCGYEEGDAISVSEDNKLKLTS